MIALARAAAGLWPAGPVLLAGGMPWGILLPVMLLGVAVGVWRGNRDAA